MLRDLRWLWHRRSPYPAAYRPLTRTGAHPLRTHRYGGTAEQVADLRLPGGRGRFPVVMLLHGGFWRLPWGRDLMNALADDLCRSGIASWNVEYRRLGSPGGGWPGTLLDVAAAADALADLSTPAGHSVAAAQLDLSRVAVLGHSAGAQLALWCAARARLPEAAPGARPRLRTVAAVSLAGVLDLAAATHLHLGDDAVTAFLGGGPGDRRERSRLASPYELLPLGVPMLLVHGQEDDVVPVTQSLALADAATAAGDEVTLATPDDIDHLGVIDPDTSAWRDVASWLQRELGIDRAEP